VKMGRKEGRRKEGGEEEDRRQIKDYF